MELEITFNRNKFIESTWIFRIFFAVGLITLLGNTIMFTIIDLATINSNMNFYFQLAFMGIFSIAVLSYLLFFSFVVEKFSSEFERIVNPYWQRVKSGKLKIHFLDRLCKSKYTKTVLFMYSYVFVMVGAWMSLFSLTTGKFLQSFTYAKTTLASILIFYLSYKVLVYIVARHGVKDLAND